MFDNNNDIMDITYLYCKNRFLNDIYEQFCTTEKNGLFYCNKTHFALALLEHDKLKPLDKDRAINEWTIYCTHQPTLMSVFIKENKVLYL